MKIFILIILIHFSRSREWTIEEFNQMCLGDGLMFTTRLNVFKNDYPEKCRYGEYYGLDDDGDVECIPCVKGHYI